MRVCSLNFHFKIGGATLTTLQIIKCISKRAQTYVIDPVQNSEFRNRLADEVKVIVLPLPKAEPLGEVAGFAQRLRLIQEAVDFARLVLVLRKIIQVEELQVLYTNQVRSASCALLAALFTGTKVVYHCHDPKDRGIRFLSLVQSNISAVVANSLTTRSALIKIGFESSRVHLIENSVAPPPIKTVSQKGSCDVFRVLVASTAVEENKGIADAIQAVAVLSRLGFPIQLSITGTLPPIESALARNISKIQQEIRLPSVVNFIGRFEEIYPVMAQQDCVVVPTKFRESFGRTAVEAMLSKVPVIVSDVDALPDIVGFGRYGLVFSRGDVKALAFKIAEIKFSPCLTSQRTHKAYEYSKRRFAPERMCRELTALLEQVNPHE